ncbi:hypothetical protein [Arthrobacter burdickii]|uniref:Uncharacterized protein n=1 Tax=Arthrobacter burdickii TaxID=3035920 RepID=A0ABT8K2Q8_9MICC|nr:hypothetical protein [Arthrobacter burdickii]MDN4611472.1 hypothetical protein [Arthrobacter burdickii]
MASARYPLFKQSLLSQSPSVDLDTDTIKVALVNTSTDYTYSASHQYKSSVTSYAGTTDQTLTSPTVALGVFDAADSTFTSVAISGTKTVQALVGTAPGSDEGPKGGTGHSRRQRSESILRYYSAASII